MKFTYAAVLASLGSAFAKVLLLAHLKESTEYVYVALPNDNKDDRLYISNKSSWDSGYCLVPKSDQQTKLITLASDYDSEKFVNVDSNGFLVLADKGYAFDRIDNGNIFINNADTFYLVKADDKSEKDALYNIKVSGTVPDGSTPVNIDVSTVTFAVKKDVATPTTITTTYV
ncbi:predicted protein [Candida tropicalis MYA-3404]|uniref:Cell wall protein RHD3 n=1 Tax=Candida tropicalis (strain ATCC MYA-3404 / T1) TaxID=294747 RepID=C5MFR1_CANTT|nr:predicted protein [Candida tropicalis MYA-3404]EER31174.1 predicted protein [Candida tropicalis MYA-3404]KAG4404738.1 hypothetical protein JTP64_005752 [Candida tropicalis]